MSKGTYFFDKTRNQIKNLNKRKLRTTLYGVSTLVILGLIAIAIIFIIKNKKVHTKDLSKTNETKLIDPETNITRLEIIEVLEEISTKKSQHLSVILTPNQKNTSKSKNQKLSNVKENQTQIIPQLHLNITTTNHSREVIDENSDILIVPGTKWCGKGSIAVSYDDLGPFEESDKCCRTHDACGKSINPGETKYGLSNTGYMVLSECDCDKQLYNCLKNVGTFASELIGSGFFTLLGPQCFKNEYPIKRCKKYQFTSYPFEKTKQKRCVQYELDKEAEKKYQFFDAPLYY